MKTSQPPISHVVFALAFCTVAAVSLAADFPPDAYAKTAVWKPGGEGHWDCLAVDPSTGRLYIARENRVQVLDTSTGALVGEVPGLNGAHGVALVPGLHRGFATSGRDGKVIVFDLGTLKQAADPIPAGTKPDIITYDSKSGLVFAMNGGSRNISVIDPASAKVTGTISLPGVPEFAVPDGEGHLFVNLEDKSEIVAIDSEALKIEREWPLDPGKGPSGLAIDVRGHRLFSGCGNGKMIVLDDTTGKVVAVLPIGAHVDGAGFDPGENYAFSSNGDGTLTIAGADKDGNFKALRTLATKTGARTMALDPRTHCIYSCTADFGPPDPNSKGRPQPLPGTFVVLKIEPVISH